MAFNAANITVLSTRPQGNGIVEVDFQAIGDNAYPAAGYDLSQAVILAKLGLKSYAVQDSGTAFVDPQVLGVNQQGFLAEVVGLKLLVSYPTGGGAASPTNPAAPLITAGAVAMTSSAANGAADVTPGVGKACAANTDLSNANVKFFLRARGYVN